MSATFRNELIAVLVEFLEATVHQASSHHTINRRLLCLKCIPEGHPHHAVLRQVLHLRQLYRPELFERQRLYGITVHKSRHPGLNEYIHSVVTSLKVRPQLYGSSLSSSSCSQHQTALSSLPRPEQRVGLSTLSAWLQLKYLPALSLRKKSACWWWRPLAAVAL